MNLIQHFVNGKVFIGSSKKTSKVFNPATGGQASEVNLASKVDLDFAVQKLKRHLLIGLINHPYKEQG